MNKLDQYFNQDALAASVWQGKYALANEQTPDDMHRRLAKEFARIEADEIQKESQLAPEILEKLSEYGRKRKDLTEEEIYELFKDFKYIVPQGSVMSILGSDKVASLSNCFVVGHPEGDSYGAIMHKDQQLAQLMKRRGGVGIDISTLRPSGAKVTNAAGTSTGAASFMERYSNTTREVAQCIKGDQKVLTKSGLKQIQDINPNEFVWTKTGWVKVESTLTSESKPLYKIKTTFGNEIICSLDHVFSTPFGDKKIGDLKIGDAVNLLVGTTDIIKSHISLTDETFIEDSNQIVSQHKECTIPLELDESLAYLLGYSHGNGYTEYNNKNIPTLLEVSVPHSHPEIEFKIKTLTKKLFSYDPKVRQGDGAVNRISIGNQHVCCFLSENGLNKVKSTDIIIPDKIWNSTSAVQISYLCGFFDADGYASGSKKGYVWTTTSEEFAKGIQTLLLSLGIASKIHIENREEKGWKSLFSISVTGKYSQTSLVYLFKDSVKISNKSFISKKDNYLSPFKAKDLNISYNKYNFIPDNNHFISISALEKLPQYENNILIQSKIKSIEYVEDNIAYDLSLEKEYLFWCEGFYVHNSGRRGALMISLDVRHPDIEDFVTKKQDPTKVTGANVSVFLRDDFMQAVKEGRDYLLRWPCEHESTQNIEDFNYNELIEVEEEFGVSFYKRIKAKQLWDSIIKCAHASAEPGIMFMDKHLDRGSDSVYEKYKPVTTNPCSEISMSPYDACRLIANNLYSYVVNPFTENAYFDFESFYKKSYEQQRLADDLVVLEMEHVDRILNKIKNDPEPEHVKRDEYELWEKIKDMTASSRRTGSGFTALGDTLAALNLKYDADEALSVIDKIMATKMEAELDCTIDMAITRGTFTGWNVHNEYEYDDKNGVTGTNDFFQFILEKFPEQANRMMKYGRRNVSFSTTAPTGSLSILTQTTSGIEPIFMVLYYRRKKINPADKGVRVDFVDQNGDKWQEYAVLHPKFITWYFIKFGQQKQLTSIIETKEYLESLPKAEVEEILKISPWYGSTANDINWLKRVEIQGIVQNYTTHSISSTINLPNDVSVEEVSDIYMHSWEQGLKGVTVYRDGCRTGVLIAKPETKDTTFHPQDAIKRPKELPCYIHHITTNKQPFTVIVGMLDNNPYEVFALPGTIMKNYSNGFLTKKKKGVYTLTCSLDEEYSIITDITSDMTEEQETITRLVSGMLRHGANVKFVTEQLQKTNGVLTSFTKAIARVLKTYIPDGEKASTVCSNCGGTNVVFEEGCSVCKDCGHSKCG